MTVDDPLAQLLVLVDQLYAARQNRESVFNRHERDRWHDRQVPYQHPAVIAAREGVIQAERELITMALEVGAQRAKEKEGQ